MWDDVTIGKGVKGCSAITVFAIKGKHNISENYTSYWVSNVYLGLGMTIFKNTDEGMHLTSMIESEKSLEEINEFLTTVLMKNVEIPMLRKATDKALNEAFKHGEAAKVRELKRVLCIDSNW